ncbi:MAG: hypothetical protein P1P64_01250, partial [Treponemataceae bacterium]
HSKLVCVFQNANQNKIVAIIYATILVGAEARALNTPTRTIVRGTPKKTGDVPGVLRGFFCGKRQRRCPYIWKRERPIHITSVFYLSLAFDTKVFAKFMSSVSSASV